MEATGEWASQRVVAHIQLLHVHQRCEALWKLAFELIGKFLKR
jgi:hypothetical protein